MIFSSWNGRSLTRAPRDTHTSPHPNQTCNAEPRSVAVDIDYGLGEGLRGFLGQVVPDATADHPVLILARELAGIGAGVRVRRAVGVALESDGRHGDGREAGQLPLQVVVLRLARGQAEPPAVIVDHDRDMIGVVESGGAARERRVVKSPLR